MHVLVTGGQQHRAPALEQLRVYYGMDRLQRLGVGVGESMALHNSCLRIIGRVLQGSQLPCRQNKNPAPDQTLNHTRFC